MIAWIKTRLMALVGGMVGAAVMLLAMFIFFLPQARQEGREAERAAIAQAALDAVKERVKDDAEREALSAYDLCVDYFRHRGRVPECDGLRVRTLREE
ncbi:hypothetical protein [uncultured Martelella sp.]|uniref:hypothetical protein n=1 Tax=uncultured Martelella sp. TaxID=392331 RepID=UPI0029C8CD70|nr:hypothetical protein [uncultured Martelella sp.]